MQISKEMKFYFTLSLIAFFISVILFDINGRLLYRDETFFFALKDCLYYLAVQPVGTVMLLAPYLTLGWVSSRASKDIKKGMCYFIPGILSLSYIYYFGYLGASYYMEQQKWTASALSVGLLPFKSIIVLPIGLLIGWVIKIIYEKQT